MPVELMPHQKKILFKLKRNFYIGGRHTSEDNVIKGFPTNERGNLKKALKKLIQSGYLIPKPTSYGLEISINPSRMKEINEILKE
ncbi:MAG: hypothetical protein U9N36_12050 [Euryarchaeota archaeon]|nr:MAG: hypothetical protein C5S48_03115 [ANME-2 cluster archaeon]MEA1895899.1 hypothetical protein [Euryarchaeota archaeon]